MIALGNRLRTVAEMVVGGHVCVDVGTDHAYLPVYLVQTGAAVSVTASDIVEGPLKNAEKTVRRYGLSDRIALRLTPGLDGIEFAVGTEIIIAGMGGTVIASILRDASERLKREDIHLILQPQSHSEDVRRWLCENGFTEEYECVCEDGGRIYSAVSAYYTGDMSRAGDEAYFLVGELPHINDDKARRLIEKQLKVARNRVTGLELCGRNPEELEKLKKALSGINC